MKNKTKSFLTNLSIAKKTVVLIVIMTIGTLLIGGVAHFGVASMKESYNTFYEKRFNTIQTLSKMRNIYTTDIPNILIKIQHSGKSVLTAKKNILKNKEDGALHWKDFLSHYYKTIDQKDTKLQNIVDSLQEQIILVNKSLENIEDKNYLFHLKNLNLLDKKISHLVTYYFEIASHEKEMIPKQFGNTQILVFIMTLLVMLLSLWFSLLITKNFQRILNSLSDTIEKRNSENEKMQQLLEKKVDEAVVKAREKDQIMYQHARLAAMGEMIGNIAHQWRQPLNALTLLIQSFGTKSLSGKLDQTFIDKQVDEGMRLAVSMSDTIEDFRNFFSPSKEKEHFDVSKSIHDTLEMSSFFCQDENIDIEVICDEDIKIYGYSNEFSQVILNFINNARDNFKHKDIHENKKILIEIKKIKSDTPSVNIYFADNGGGIEEHIIDRVFEPYFTTKHKASGTGIGLYMSKQIIEAQMNGEVSVKNLDKKFNNKNYRCAEFKISIPV